MTETGSRPYDAEDPSRPDGAMAGTEAGRDFALRLPAGWRDRTTHVFAGPVVDGHGHTVTVVRDPGETVLTLEAFAGRQVAAMRRAMPGCAVLLQDRVAMHDGTAAHRAIFRWHPEGGRPLYQEQLYVVGAGGGYVLSAAFTPRTRRTMGPIVEQVMRSFSLSGAP